MEAMFFTVSAQARLLPAWDSIGYAAPLDQQACDLLRIALKSLRRRQSAFCTGILHHNGSLTRSFGLLKKVFCLSSACQCPRGHQQSPLQRTQSLILIRLLHGGVYCTRGLPDRWRLCVAQRSTRFPLLSVAKLHEVGRSKELVHH